jgi:MFS family permease
MLQNLKIFNRTIGILTLSDVFVWGIYMVAYPLQGIYMTYKYGYDSIQYLAVGLSIYYFMRAILQVPIGILLDRVKSDNDEIWSLGIGSLFIGLNFVLFPFTQNPIQYYLVMGLAGIGASFNLLGWRKLFAKNLDKNKEGQSYAAYEAVMSFCTGIFSLVSGKLSSINYQIFTDFFIVVGVITIVGGLTVVMFLFKTKRKTQVNEK